MSDLLFIAACDVAGGAVGIFLGWLLILRPDARREAERRRRERGGW